MILLRQKWSYGLFSALPPLLSLPALFTSSLPKASTLLTRVPASLVLGTKTGTDTGDGTCEPGLASPASYLNPLPVLHLVEDLRLALQTLERPQERTALLSQIPGPTAAYIKEWFEESLVSRPRACLGNHWGTSSQSPRNATTAWGCYFICPPSSLSLLPIQLQSTPTGWSCPGGG